MTEEEKGMRGPFGLWKFPMLNRGLASEEQKEGEGFLSRTLERAPNFIISQAGKTASAIAGSAAKDAVTGRLAGGSGILSGIMRPGLLL